MVVDDNPQLRLLREKSRKAKDPIQIPEECQLKPLPKMKTNHLKLPSGIWLLKRFSISFNGVSDIPSDLILYIDPSCQTLSKALEMSEKFSLTSKGGLQSNDL